MKKSILTLILMVAMLPLMANSFEQLADGVYQDGSTLYISSSVTSLDNLQVNPSVSNTFTGYGATLHVPAAGMVSYFTTFYWYNFNNILSDAIEPLSVTTNTDEAELEIGQHLSLSATVVPSNATPNTVYWSSTNTSVATVSSGGTVTAVAVGECEIWATCIDKISVCHVTVTSPRVTITLDNHEASLLPNHTLALNTTCSPFAVELAVTSSNPEVAIPRIVNGSIMVVGVAEGTAAITVNAADGRGNPDTCEVTVYTETGDVNCDGYINIGDVTALIDYLLNGDTESISVKNADIEQDGNVSIGDVTALIDYLLSGRWPWEEPYEPHTETFTVNGVTFTMVAVKGGTFTIGASDDDEDAMDNEKPAHLVTLSGYSIGETEVTQALWLAVMGSNPSNFTGYLQHPVENVSWEDCKTFIIKLSQLTGKAFRLPTEAEWEFAARGGNKSKGYKYAGGNTIGDVAWCYDYPYNDRKTHAVATKAPNELGLYDMSGNVSEWCRDRYGSYNGDAQTNPIGPSTGSYRVHRGGSWANTPSGCRVSYRAECVPEYEYSSLGLRLALGPNISPEPEDHEWVDLGLPSGTLWATCNVGADSPEEYGDYFAWGETEPQGGYSWAGYRWCNGSLDLLTKYCTKGTYGWVDNNTDLDHEDDAAYVNWGALWRMPTWVQLQELMDYCTWTRAARNGVNGQLATGPNGNTIFLPAAGNLWNESLYDVGSCGYFWSRTLNQDYPYNAYFLYFGSDIVGWNSNYRCKGLSIRAVRVSQN